MANKKIPLKDKELVKQRLAQGLSTREAIKGTSIKSPQTAGKISKQELSSIEQIKTKYLILIEEFGAGHIDRARLWAEMTQATKIHSSHTEPDREVPDWQNREKALRYIDTLAGIYQEKGTTVAIGVKFSSPEFKKDYEY